MADRRRVWLTLAADVLNSDHPSTVHTVHNFSSLLRIVLSDGPQLLSHLARVLECPGAHPTRQLPVDRSTDQAVVELGTRAAYDTRLTHPFSPPLIPRDGRAGHSCSRQEAQVARE